MLICWMLICYESLNLGIARRCTAPLSTSTTSLRFSWIKANMPVLLVILTFFEGGGFVDRNGMVVSLHRDWVAAHHDESPVGLTLNNVTLARQRKRDCPAPISLCLHPNSTQTPLTETAFGKSRAGGTGLPNRGRSSGSIHESSLTYLLLGFHQASTLPQL